VTTRPGARISGAWTGLVTLSLVFLAGCGGVGRSLSSDSPFDRGGNRTGVILRVDNQNIHEAAIYARVGGRLSLLGKVDARSIRFLDFEWPIRNPLTLELELAVGERYVLQPYTLPGGGRVELTVAEELRRSRIQR